LADEVVSAVDFHYLTKTGQHFDGSHAGLLAYLTPAVDGRFAVSLFGGTTVSDFRLAAAFFGVATVGLVIWLGFELSGIVFGTLSAAALAVMPWHIYFSRIFFPGTECLFLTTLALCLELSALRRRSLLLATGSAVAAAGSIYLYPVALVSTPLLMACVLVFRWSEVRKFGRVAGVLGTAALGLGLLLPYAYEHLVVTDPIIGNANSVLAQKLIWNHGLDAIGVVQLFVYNWTSYLHPQFILLTGDPNVRQSTERIGAVGWGLGILGCIGVAHALIRPNRFGWFLIGLTAAYPVGDALTYFDAPSNSLRGLAGSVVWAMWAALGVRAVLRIAPKLAVRQAFAFAIAAIVLIQSSVFLTDYLTTYMGRYGYAFETGYSGIYDILQSHGLNNTPITLHAGYERFAMVEYFSQYRLHAADSLLSCGDLPTNMITNSVLPRIFIVREDRDFAAYSYCVDQRTLIQRDEEDLASLRRPGEPTRRVDVIVIFPNDATGDYETAILYVH